MLTRYRGLLPGPGTGTYIPSKDRFGKEAILFKILILLLYSQFLFNFDILCILFRILFAGHYLTAEREGGAVVIYYRWYKKIKLLPSQKK